MTKGELRKARRAKQLQDKIESFKARQERNSQKQSELHLQNVDRMLAQRKPNPPKQKNLTSVHSELQGTKSKDYVTKLKRKPTEAELLVIEYLDRMHREYVFQMPIKNDYSFYIVDFYIPRYKLCIEVDGGYHNNPTQTWRDEQRDNFLFKKGYKVFRFTNEEVLNTTHQQFKKILKQYETTFL